MKTVTYSTKSHQQTTKLGERIGRNLRGGEVFELKSDLGGGKTTFVSGLAKGFGSPDPVASPSFTINYVYTRPDKKQLFHFDFYRLEDPGIIANELAEVENDPGVVTAVEWSDIVHDLLPEARVIVAITATAENTRTITVTYAEEYEYLFSETDRV
jgi:tRNA threonylcarbamoyladenosine biosynthesis protein TsaE